MIQMEMQDIAPAQFENKVKKVYEADISLKSDHQPAPFLSLFRFADKKDYIFMALGSICAVANGIAIPFFAFPYGDLTEAFSQNAAKDIIVQQVKKAYIVFLVNSVFVFLFSWIMFSTWMITSERQSIKCRKVYFEALMRQEVAWYDHTRLQQLASNIYSDSSQLQNAIGEKVSKIFMTTSMGIAGFLIAYIRGWKLAIVVTAVIPFLLAAGFFNNHYLKQASEFMNRIMSRAQGIAEQVLYSIKTVKFLHGEQYEADKYRQKISKATQKMIDYGYIRGTMSSLFFFSIIMTYAIGFWYGSVLVGNREINSNSGKLYTVGDVIVIFFTVYMSGLNLGQIPECLKNFMVGRKAAARIFSIIDRQPLIVSGEGKITENIIGITFDNMQFYYQNPLFERFNLTLKKGKTAFVGESGCGKSTLVGLIMRFYDPSQGNIFLNFQNKQVNLKDLDLVDFRQKIGYVGQEPVLIGSTIRQAISLIPRQQQDIIRALKAAEAWEQVKKIGLDSEYGSLSGGQKQRIAIARAIIKKPQILILDEATSALDRRNQKQIQATLDKLQVPFMIVVAHKIQTIKSSDEIIVLRSGSIEQRGNYSELMKKRGMFYELAKQQQQLNEEEHEHHLPFQTDSMEGSAIFRKNSQLNLHQSNNPVVDINKSEAAIAAGSSPQNPEQARAQEQFSWALFWRLLNYNKRYLWLMILGLIAAAFTGTVFPLFSSFLSNIVVVLSSMKNSTDNTQLAIYSEQASNLSKILFIISVLGMLFHFIKSCAFLFIAQKLSFSLRKDVYRKLLVLPYPYHEKKEGKQTARILSGDCQSVNGLTSQLLSDVLQNSTTLIVGIIIALVNCWQITLVALALIPILLLAGKAQMNFNVGFSTQTDEAYKRSHQIVLTSILNYRTVLAFNLSTQMKGKYDQLLEQPLKIAIKKGNIAGLLYGLSQMVLSCILSLIFFIGSLFIQDDKMGTDVLKIFTAIYAIMFAAIQAGGNLQFIPSIAVLKVAAVNIFRVLDQQDQQQLERAQSARLQLQNARGNIELRKIGFKYENRNDFVFKDLSLTIQQGQKVAFVGSSGCGKSTILQLLMRMYPLTEGEIYLDGHRINDYRIGDLRAQFGVVSQQPVLFNRSVTSNIKYNKKSITDEQVIKAAKKANAFDFVVKGNFGFDPNSQRPPGDFQQQLSQASLQPDQAANSSEGPLPEGFKRKVGVKGSFLSGGQKQRVAIARAIVRKPRILLLDEATSALDTKNQQEVQKALDSIEGLTTIIVAHRLSTIERCDKIFVFDKGRIVQEGAYQELLQLRGYFWKLANGLAEKPKRIRTKQ